MIELCGEEEEAGGGGGDEETVAMLDEAMEVGACVRGLYNMMLLLSQLLYSSTYFLVVFR